MTKIDGKTSLLGLLGYPIEHTLSPAMHNAALDALDLNYLYLPLPVRPEDLDSAISGLVAVGFVGVNVTIPHKQAVIRYLDEISDEAQAIGAVNMIEFKGGKRTGHNLDGFGFLKALSDRNVSVRGCRSLVLGAGGAARAVAYTLLRSGSSVTILNRTKSRAASLAAALRPYTHAQEVGAEELRPDIVADHAAQVDLVVNTTSVGMTPNEEGNPWPKTVPFPARAIAYDLVYAPLETAFLRTASAAGAQTVDGLQMLLYQGAIAFEMWTGHPAPLEIMSNALKERRMSS